MVALPAYSMGNALNFQPVTNALAQVTAQNNANRQYGLDERQSARADQALEIQKQTAADTHKAAGLEYEKALAGAYGGWAQTISSLPPEQQGQATSALIASHPEFATQLKANGVDPNDGPTALKFITSVAQGYQNPLDVAAKKAQIEGLQGENAIRGKQWGQVGRDLYGQPTYGVVDLTKPNAGMPTQPQAAAGQPLVAPPQGASGADYLKTLPKPMADQVQAIAEGRIPIPGGFALKTPYWQQMMTHVSQYDPTFDAVNYNSRAATRKDFTSGKSAQNVTSFNTAIGHLDELDHAIDGLKNTDYTPVNAATNATASVNADRARRLSAFGTARNAVVEELTRAFKGTGGSLTEVEGWEKLLDPNASPAALKQAVHTAVNLLASRIDSVGEQYNKGMGTTSDPVKLLTPKAQKLWLRLNGGDQTAQPTSDVPAGTPLAAPKSKAEYDALPSGTRYTDPEGTPRVKP